MADPQSGGNILDQLVRPAKALLTSVGTLHLYRLRNSDLAAAESLPGQSPSDRIRGLLPLVTSLVEVKGSSDKRLPLPATEVERLSGEEIERFAEEYANIMSRNAPAQSTLERPKRDETELASAYLDRLLRYIVEEQKQPNRETHENMRKSVVGGMFDKVLRSSATLGTTIGAYERLAADTVATKLHAPSMETFDVLNKESRRISHERAEELEMVRLTGKMTAESAKTLKDLAEAATTLLSDMKTRDERANRVTNIQIWIAVGSVMLSAALAGVSMVVAVLGYKQDSANAEAGDRWQRDLLGAVIDGNRKQAGLIDESKRLRSRMTAIEGKAASMESHSASSVPPMPRGASGR